MLSKGIVVIRLGLPIRYPVKYVNLTMCSDLQWTMSDLVNVPRFYIIHTRIVKEITSEGSNTTLALRINYILVLLCLSCFQLILVYVGGIP